VRFARAIVLALLVVGQVYPATLSAKGFDFEKLPMRYAARPQSMSSGVMDSAFSSRAQEFQSHLTLIESKIYGLNNDVMTNIDQAEQVYYMEHLVLGYYQMLLDKPDTIGEFEFERHALLYRTRHLYMALRHKAEELFEIMLREISMVLPGASGIQLPTILNLKGEFAYSPNYRYEHGISAEQARSEYKAKYNEFINRGGSLSELHTLSPDHLRQFKKFTSVEYAAKINGEIRVTEGDAGHTLLAEGQDVLAAGQILFLKDKLNNLRFLVVSNSSGNFKPDMYSVALFANRLAVTLNFPIQDVVLTKGEPMSFQTVKVMMKAEGAGKDEIKARAQEAQALGQKIFDSPLSFISPGKNHSALGPLDPCAKHFQL
jgi:hypothetical protein